MPPTRAELVRALERSHALFEEAPGLHVPLGIAGVRGFSSALRHPIANRVVPDGLSADTAEAAIEAVDRRFTELERPYGWILGPSRRPPDLAERLARRGLVKILEQAGLALTDLSLPVPAARDVEVRTASPEEQRAHAGALAEAFRLPEAAVLHNLAVREGAREGVRSVSYLAFVEGEAAPAAFADLVWLPGTHIVLLGGAATRREHRGRGVYRALLRRRLEDARADGAEAAIVLAIRTTSAPILCRLGFEEVCGFEIWVGGPGADGVEPPS